MSNFCKLISINVTNETVELEWFYFDGSLQWTGVSLIEVTIPVAPWADKHDVEKALRNWAMDSNIQSPIRGFELNSKDWTRLAQCGRI